MKIRNRNYILYDLSLKELKLIRDGLGSTLYDKSGCKADNYEDINKLLELIHSNIKQSE